jgi:hypothetical protein
MASLSSNCCCVRALPCAARALQLYARVAAPPGVDGKCKWKQRSTDARYDPNDFAANLPVSGHPDYMSAAAAREDEDDDDDDGAPDDKQARRGNVDRRRTFMPFTSAQLAEIDKGVHASEKYKKAALNMIEVAKEEDLKRATAASEGSTTQRPNRQRKVLSRPRKFERVLTRTLGDTCEWSPSKERWLHVCGLCCAIKCHYCYDRGLSKIHLFKDENIKCFVRQKKGQPRTANFQLSEQMWSETTASSAFMQGLMLISPRARFLWQLQRGGLLRACAI